MAEKSLNLRYTADTSAVTAGLRRMEAAHASFGSRIAGFGSKMDRVGRKMTHSLTLPIVGAGLASVKLAVDFEDSMAKIEGLVGVSSKTVAKWGDDILSMARKLPQGPKELADALFFVTSAGFRGAKAMDVLRMSARAAAAGLGETRDVADAITSALNAYAGTGLKASNVTDTLVAGVREGKMPVDALASAIGQILGPAAELGVSFQEVVGTAASLSRVGVPVNRTMTGLRFLMVGLAKPSSEAARILEDVGISADQLRQSLRERGLLVTLQELKDKLPIQDFLKVVGGARGVVTALGLVGKNAAQVRDVMDGVTKSTGSTDKAFEVMSRTAGFKFKAALSSLQATAIQVGNKILPMVTKLVEFIGHLADKFSTLSPAMQSNILKWGLLLAAAGPVLRIFGGLLRIGGPLVTVLGRIATAAFGASKGVSSLNTAGASGGAAAGRGAAAGGSLISTIGSLGAAIAGAATLGAGLTWLTDMSIDLDKAAKSAKLADGAMDDMLSTIKKGGSDRSVKGFFRSTFSGIAGALPFVHSWKEQAAEAAQSVERVYGELVAAGILAARAQELVNRNIANAIPLLGHGTGSLQRFADALRAGAGIESQFGGAAKLTMVGVRRRRTSGRRSSIAPSRIRTVSRGSPASRPRSWLG